MVVDEYIVLKVIEKKLVELSDEGLQYAKNGTPEFSYASKLEVDKPTNKADFDKELGGELGKIGFAKAMTKKWVKLDPTDKNLVIRVEKNIEDTDRI